MFEKLRPNKLQSKKTQAGQELLKFSKEFIGLSSNDAIKRFKNQQKKHKDFLNEKASIKKIDHGICIQDFAWLVILEAYFAFLSNESKKLIKNK